MTIVCDLMRSTVEYVSEGRRKESLESYYEGMNQEQLGAIRGIAMDM